MADELRTEFLMELTANLSESVYRVGDGGRGARTVVVVTGGSFEGPHLRGTVAPVGGDWVVRRSDGVSQLDVRALLQTDDGAEIQITYGGYNHQQTLGPLGDLAEGTRYFRTLPVFETGDERYAWLNRIVAVGDGRSDAPGTVTYRIHAVL
jgi:hypothetical protein